MELSIFLTRIYNDTRDYSGFNYIYIYAHQPHFYHDILSGLQLINKNAKIYILDSPVGLSGYQGFLETKKLVIDSGIDESRIYPIKFRYAESGMVNTLNESQNLVNFLREKNINKILIVTATFHLPRAFLSLVSCNSNLIIGCLRTSYINDWNKQEYVHSQGTCKGTINDLFSGEISRIYRYHKKKDLISIKKALKYLDDRKL